MKYRISLNCIIDLNDEKLYCDEKLICGAFNKVQWRILRVLCENARSTRNTIALRDIARCISTEILYVDSQRQEEIVEDELDAIYKIIHEVDPESSPFFQILNDKKIVIYICVISKESRVNALYSEIINYLDRAWQMDGDIQDNDIKENDEFLKKTIYMLDDNELSQLLNMLIEYENFLGKLDDIIIYIQRVKWWRLYERRIDLTGNRTSRTEDIQEIEDNYIAFREVLINMDRSMGYEKRIVRG